MKYTMALSKEASGYQSTFRGYEGLTEIRDLIILMDQHNIHSRKVLRDYAVKEHIFTTKINRLDRHAGEIYRKSGIYHYESPLLSLCIVNKELRDDRISFTSTGKRLAGIAREKDEYKSKQVSDELKREFAPILAANAAFRKVFFSRFFPKAVREYESLNGRKLLKLFRLEGSPIYIQPDDRERYFRVNGASLNSECNEFRGMLNLAKQTGIVEEITISEPEKFNLKPEKSHIVFPIMDPDDLKRVELSDFRKWIDEQMDGQNGRVRRLALPELMYRICSTRGLDKATFKRLLKALNRSDPIQYRLEKASTAFIDERRHQLDNYLKVNGLYRGTLAVMR